MKTVITRIGSEGVKWHPRIVIFVLTLVSSKTACFVNELCIRRIVWRCILVQRMNTVTNV